MGEPLFLGISPDQTRFEEDYPQVYRFLQQFRVDVEDNSQYINEIGFKERDEM